MNKKSFLPVGVFAALLVISTAGYSWNFATHAYIAGKIGSLVLPLKLNQVYGIMAPDIFNLDFSTWGDNLLRAYTHGIPKGDPTVPPSQLFMNVWRQAIGPFEKADASGYVAHNDAWGADYVAHWKGIPPPPPFPPGYENEHPGYIIALAVQLDQFLENYGVWAGLEANGVTLTMDDRMTFTENIIEYAGDILIKRVDPGIGDKIYQAAFIRTSGFPDLLVRAFPQEFSAQIPAAEETFRQQMMQYGLLFKFYEEPVIISTISEQLAGFGIQYLAFKMGVDPSVLYPTFMPILLPIATLAMQTSVQLCQDANYIQEVNVTALYVALQLVLHDVIFFSFW